MDGLREMPREMRRVDLRLILALLSSALLAGCAAPLLGSSVASAGYGVAHGPLGNVFGSLSSAETAQALGYDLNTVEFACEKGVPYAIDFLNPAPDADIHSVGRENFEWIVNAVAEMAVEKAQEAPKPREYRWAAFLNSAQGAKA